MYAGTIVESGPTRKLFAEPQPSLHARAARLRDRPRRRAGRRLVAIPGEVPDLVDVPPGCIFAARCRARFEKCARGAAARRRWRPDHRAACWLARMTHAAPPRSRRALRHLRRRPAGGRRRQPAALPSARPSAWSARAARARRRSPRRWSASTGRPRARSASRAATYGAHARRPAVAPPPGADDLPGPAVVAVAAPHHRAGCSPSRIAIHGLDRASAGRRCWT